MIGKGNRNILVAEFIILLFLCVNLVCLKLVLKCLVLYFMKNIYLVYCSSHYDFPYSGEALGFHTHPRVFRFK